MYIFTNDLHSKHSLDEPLAGEVGVESMEEDIRAQRSGLKVGVESPLKLAQGGGVLSQNIVYERSLRRVNKWGTWGYL
mgnify:CR=1 FL=1